jgi:hypothetical protein
MTGDTDLAGLAALAPNATRHTEAGSVFYYLPRISFRSCGQIMTTEALLCTTPHAGYPTRLMLANRAPKHGNWFTHQALARNWHWLSVSGIAADRPSVEILAEHLEMYR